MLAPAQSIFADRVERPLTRETVEVPLVLGRSLQRILFVETHKRLAPLPRPLAPVAKSFSTLKKLENLLMGKGRFFSSCLALLARVSSLNCSSVFTASTILSTYSHCQRIHGTARNLIFMFVHTLRNRAGTGPQRRWVDR